MDDSSILQSLYFPLVTMPIACSLLLFYNAWLSLLIMAFSLLWTIASYLCLAQAIVTSILYQLVTSTVFQAISCDCSLSFSFEIKKLRGGKNPILDYSLWFCSIRYQPSVCIIGDILTPTSITYNFIINDNIINEIRISIRDLSYYSLFCYVNVHYKGIGSPSDVQAIIFRIQRLK